MKWIAKIICALIVQGLYAVCISSKNTASLTKMEMSILIKEKDRIFSSQKKEKIDALALLGITDEICKSLESATILVSSANDLPKDLIVWAKEYQQSKNLWFYHLLNISTCHTPIIEHTSISDLNRIIKDPSNQQHTELKLEICSLLKEQKTKLGILISVYSFDLYNSLSFLDIFSDYIFVLLGCELNNVYSTQLILNKLQHTSLVAFAVCIRWYKRVFVVRNVYNIKIDWIKRHALATEMLSFGIKILLMVFLLVSLSGCILIVILLHMLTNSRSTAKKKTILTYKEIKKIPVSLYHEDLSVLQTQICVICLDKFTTSCICRLLPCNHIFHIGCIDPWLSTRSIRCPYCQLPIVI
ncbi:hypothetical protein NEOKW01_2116 [Nematocida sp. AWRm80]|nr:hypothetical protein NEOKW01_2116 [Nematocida sp. AWRm80]